MKYLVLDFLKRWWWLVLVFAVVVFVSAGTGSPVVFTVLAFFAMLFDSQRGLPRILSTLPISRRTQALTWWFVGVLLLPLVAMIILPLGLWADVFSITNKKNGLPMNELWFRAAASWWLALGYGAFLSLLSLTFPTRQAVTVGERFGAALAALSWGFSAFGGLWLLRLMPRQSADLEPTHWVWLGVVPLLVILSFLAAPTAVKRRLQRGNSESLALAEQKQETLNARALTGMSLLVVKMQSTTVGVYLSGLVAVWVASLVSGRFHQALASQTMDRVTVMFVVLICFLIPDTVNVRMLRIMPISTARLTALLLMAPIIIGLLSAGAATFMGFSGDPQLPLWVNRSSQAVAVTGLGIFMLAVSLNLSTALRYFTMIVLIMLTSASVEFLPSHPLPCLVLGSAAILGSSFWVFQGLKRSFKPYRPRQVYGQSWGQLPTPR